MKKFLPLFFFQFVFFFPVHSQSIDNHIKVDQFGYLPNSTKVAILSNPQTGYNASSPYSIGSTYEVRKISDNSTVFTGSAAPWGNDEIHDQSGDKVAWFDFSSLTTPGNYYIYDQDNNVRSYEFEISDCVYNEVLKQAVRTYYYQRCGVAKEAPYAETGWTDAACHTGTEQDTDCRLHSNTSSTTSKDLSGGWHDAGDYNKYVNFTWGAMIDLLLAYEENPTVWKDDYNIPESGNGIPDLLDEIKFELDWLLKMQQSDGSILSVVGGGAASPPSSDTDERRYGPATTSASLTAAGIFALASIQFEAAGLTAYASTLETAAIDAWDWASANPNVTFKNTDFSLAAGEQELDAESLWERKLCVSAFLFALTGDATYQTYFDSNYDNHPGGGYWYSWPYVYAYEWDIQEAMLYYTKTSGATSGVASNIKTRYTNGTKNHNDNYNGILSETDAYRSYVVNSNYNWGSNSIKCHQGLMYENMITYNMDAGTHTGYRNASAEYIHYMHGVNPNAFTYLSNMSAYGAENSINEFYHSWFNDGNALWDRVGTSTYGPAPGFVPGGPNKNYDVDDCCASSCSANPGCATGPVTPPLGQPVQKAYKDWNTSWPENSWEVTENAIYYQASYVRLLSKFCSASCSTPTGIISAKNHSNSVSIYPNPNSGQFTVNANFNKTGVVELEIINSLGEVVMKKTETNAGTENLSFNLENVPNGVYYIIIQNGDERKTGKFVKAY